MERLVFTNAAGKVCCDAPADHPARLCPACAAALTKERHAAMLAARRFATDHPDPAPSFESMRVLLEQQGILR